MDVSLSAAGHICVVGDHDDRRAPILIQPVQQRKKAGDVLGVKAAGGFIG
jgi:hypothetical protein